MKSQEAREAFIRNIPFIKKIRYRRNEVRGFTYFDVEINIEGNSISYIPDAWYRDSTPPPIRGEIPLQKFLSRIKRLHLEEWDLTYRPPLGICIADGKTWELEFYFTTLWPLKFYGENAYPKNFKSFERLLKDLCPEARKDG